jgi:hypothetical protein
MFRMSRWHMMTIGVSGRAVVVVSLNVDHTPAAMALSICRDGHTDRCADGAAGNGTIAPANLGANCSSQSATDCAAQYSITVYGECGCCR